MPAKQFKPTLSSKTKSKNDKSIEAANKKPHKLSDRKSLSPSVSTSTKDMKKCHVREGEIRLISGHNEPSLRNAGFAKAQKVEPNELLHSEKTIDPAIIEIKLSDSHTNVFLQRHIKCLYDTRRKLPGKMSHGTQTLYRESSMQTLPYLPDVCNDKEALKTLELFKLPKILSGEGPPGLWEVEILERARKRWAFEKAIRENFQCAMKGARTEAARKKLMPHHKTILEAFEWEHWLQREELIQGCQMMRFQLVLQIFEKRERELHKNATTRIQRSCDAIIQKRDRALKKNEIEFGREMRRLNIKHSQKPRNWRKEKISDELCDPGSEYYAPQMRYGVNPNRRHFQISRKAFEMRMEDLGKRAVNMKNLECPFAKLKEWSKPKVQELEVEPNFCTETNLQKLYEGLKNLREQSKKQKIVPKCLIEKQQKIAKDEKAVRISVSTENWNIAEDVRKPETDHEEEQEELYHSRSSLLEMNTQRRNQSLSNAEIIEDRLREELEIMLAEYEGTHIGWLMRFLSEEMCRLQEQRKLHFITMLAQKERWRREAAEAGLRQKENEMRKIYEDIFSESNEANEEVCDQYLENIFGVDTQEQADFEATTNVTELAKLIDTDLQRWISSFKPIQNALNYDSLRCLLRNLVFPEEIAECLHEKFETQSIVDYIINDVLMERIYEMLEPWDISSTVVNNLVDRLIDNDLYLFTSDASSGCECEGICRCRVPQMEVKAIIRKLIRYSVPGRRWRTQTERIADENVNDITENIPMDDEETEFKHCQRTLQSYPSQTDLFSQSNCGLMQLISGTSTDNTYAETANVVRYQQQNHIGISFDHPSASTSTGNVSKSSLSQPDGKETTAKISLKEAKSFISLMSRPQSQHIPYSTESESESQQESHFSEEGKRLRIKSLIQFQVLKSPHSSYSGSTETTIKSEEEGQLGSFGALLEDAETKYDTTKYAMAMYEGDLEKILAEDDSCICQREIDQRNYIRQLHEHGLIRVIRKQSKTTTFESETEQTGRDVNVAEMMFEYMTSVDEHLEESLFARKIQEDEVLSGPEEYKDIYNDLEEEIEIDDDATQKSGEPEEKLLTTVDESTLLVADAPIETTMEDQVTQAIENAEQLATIQEQDTLQQAENVEPPEAALATEDTAPVVVAEATAEVEAPNIQSAENAAAVQGLESASMVQGMETEATAEVEAPNIQSAENAETVQGLESASMVQGMETEAIADTTAPDMQQPSESPEAALELKIKDKAPDAEAEMAIETTAEKETPQPPEYTEQEQTEPEERDAILPEKEDA